jgi:hypothetical protein
MTLADLYPHGTKLVDVPPNFRGMPLREYLSLPVTQRLAPVLPEAIAHNRALYIERCQKQNRTPWFEKHVHTPRDNYGIMGV